MLNVTNLSGANILPSSGGSVRVNGNTEFAFTPNQSGQWEFRTSENGSSDPLLEIYDSNRRLLAEDDDSGGNYNALITANLNANESYVINARFWGDGSGSYRLTVTRR